MYFTLMGSGSSSELHTEEDFVGEPLKISRLARSAYFLQV